MSVLLKQWLCLDDLAVITSEDEYRIHTAMYPNHKIVVDVEGERQSRQSPGVVQLTSEFSPTE